MQIETYEERDLSCEEHNEADIEKFFSTGWVDNYVG